MYCFQPMANRSFLPRLVQQMSSKLDWNSDEIKSTEVSNISNACQVWWVHVYHDEISLQGKALKETAMICAKKYTPLETNMTLENLIFKRKHIFKWWSFHCHVDFFGGSLNSLNIPTVATCSSSDQRSPLWFLQNKKVKVFLLIYSRFAKTFYFQRKHFTL